MTITGGASGTLNIIQQVAAGSWNEFGHNSKPEQRNPNAGLIYVNMDPNEWYPIGIKDGSKVSTLAGQTKPYGLHITATKKISVYVIVRAEASMDASNILPVTAIGSEYYVQDYVPEAHNDESAWSLAGHVTTLTTILATENGTRVVVDPTNTPFGKTNANPFTVNLDQGEVYYLVSKEGEQLAGTHIEVQDGKKIAIFTCLATTRLPNGVSARDALFEQSMPVEYWGTQFIVTRSLRKNGNLIGINKETGEQCFTWQPHGSQFTIHARIPQNAVKFKIKQPPKLDVEETLRQINFSDEWIEKVRANQPELREAKMKRYQETYGIPDYDIRLLP